MDNVISIDLRSEAAKVTRQKECIPGVLYGENVHEKIQVTHSELAKVLDKYIYNKICIATLNDKTYEIKFNEIQRDPVSNDILHIDLCVVNKERVQNFLIPIEVEGALPSNAKITIPAHTVKVRCLPASAPKSIKCNLLSIINGGRIYTTDLHIDGVQFLNKQSLVEVKIKK